MPRTARELALSPSPSFTPQGSFEILHVGVETSKAYLEYLLLLMIVDIR